MDIPNLNPQTNIINSTAPPLSKPILFIIIILTLSLGYWASRLIPVSKNSLLQNQNILITNPENLTEPNQIEPNKLYGNLSKAFKDTATGTIEKGSINGEGTHILNRQEDYFSEPH